MRKMNMTEEEARYFHINFNKMLKSMGHYSADLIINRMKMEEYSGQNLILLPSRSVLLACFNKENYVPSHMTYQEIMRFYCLNFKNADPDNFLKQELTFTQEVNTKVSLAKFFGGFYYCYYDFEQLDSKGRMLGGVLYFAPDKDVNRGAIKVKAILGFTDNHTMKDERIWEILKVSNTEKKLEAFREQLKPHQKRFTYYEGDFCEWEDYSRIELQNPKEKKNGMICFQTVDQSTQTNFQSCIGIFIRISKNTHNLVVRKICITRKFFSLEDEKIRNCMEQDIYQLKVFNQESSKLYELVIERPDE